MHEIADIKIFWKTITCFLLSKVPSSSKFILNEKETVVFDDQRNQQKKADAESGIRKQKKISNTVRYFNPVLIVTKTFQNDRSIFAITKNLLKRV